MRPTLQNGINLAYWLAKVHPEVYARIRPLALRSTQQQQLGALGDDVSASDIGVTTTFDTSSDVLSPDLTALPAPDLSTVGLDAATGFTTPSFSAGASAAIDPTAASTGFLGSIGGDLASVGKWLTSAVGLSSVSNVATAVIKANTPQSQTVQTQVARVASGTNPAPITYALSSNGQVVPVLQPAQAAGVGLTSQTLKNLLPGSLQPYALPIGLGIVALILWGSRRSRR